MPSVSTRQATNPSVSVTGFERFVFFRFIFVSPFFRGKFSLARMVSRVFRPVMGKVREAVFFLPSRAGTVPAFYYTEVFARVPTPKGQKGGKKKNFFRSDPLFFRKKGGKREKRVGLRFSTERRGREKEKTGFFAKSGFFGVPERIRTADLPLRRRTLYPAELRKQGRVGRACFLSVPVRLFILTHPRPFCKRIFVFLRHFV